MRMQADRSDRRTTALCAVAVCAITLLHAALSVRTVGHFSDNSWTYFELSQSVFTDFYRVPTICQYAVESAYAVTFPPLVPSLIAVWNAVWPSAVYAGVWINLIVALLTVLALLALGRRLVPSDVPALVTSAALLGNPWYLEEVMGGRSIPTAFLCFLLAIHLLHRLLTGGGGAVVSAAGGAAAGLAVEARVDFLLPAVALGVAMTIVLARTRPRDAMVFAAAYGGGLALAAAPWMVYSTTHFGVPIVSDNVRRVLTAGSVGVRQFVPFPEAIDTLANAPVAWALRKTAQSWRVMRALGMALAVSPVMVLAATWVRRRHSFSPLPPGTTVVLAVGWLALSMELVSTLGTSYDNVRYWIAFTTWSTLTAAVGVFGRGTVAHPGAMAAVLIVPAQILLVMTAAPWIPHVSVVLSIVWAVTTVVAVAMERYLRRVDSAAIARAAMAAALLVPLLAIGAGSAFAARQTGVQF